MSKLLLNPRNDVVFKLLFTRNPNLLRSMLEAVLAERIDSLTVQNPELPGELHSDKGIVLDVRVLLADGKRIDVEMQMRVTPELRSRLVYYAARDYSRQLTPGESYASLTPTTLVVWLEQPLERYRSKFHSIFEFRERESGELFSDQIVLHLLQLRDCPPTGAHGPLDSALVRWAQFLSVDTFDKLASLAAEDPIMAEAAHSLEHLSQDPEAARLAREREDSAFFYRMGLRLSREEGIAEGREVGIAEGERLTLRQSIVQLCQLFNIELTTERQLQLEVDSEQLRKLLGDIALHRVWPG